MLKPQHSNQHYLKNRTLLKNLHLSKASYTWYEDGTMKTTKYRDYDIILCDPETYEECKNQIILQMINRKRYNSGKNRTSNISEEELDKLDDDDIEESVSKIIKFDESGFTDEVIYNIKLGYHNKRLYESNKNRVKEITQEEQDVINLEDCVIRVYTFSHIPLDEKKIYKKVADKYVPLNFPPYKHYVLHNGKLHCVAMSHYNKNKEFSTTHGQINNDHAMGILLICSRYAQSHNWRGYSYAEDMQGHAVVQLTQVGLQFNELFSENVFAYYTQSIKNAFTIIFNQEKIAQTTRDNLLIEQMKSPSWTRQLEMELSSAEHWNDVLEKQLNSDVTDVSIEKYKEENDDNDYY